MIELCEATEDNPFIHGMSKQFVKALQQLFDVMDTESNGTIKYVDLASQWEEDENDPYFPKGLITCLAKVALPNGLLTFDRFCAGIKLCLLKNQVELKESKGEDGLIETGQCSESSLNVLNTMDRPSSEPKIFAPPPPSSLVSSHISNIELNNNTIANTSVSSLHKNVSALNSFSTSNTNLSEESPSKAKKLPLPSYEQAVASKSKSTSKLSIDKIPNHPKHYASSSDFSNLTPPKPNITVNQRINSLVPNKQPIDDKQLNFYENFHTLSNESTRYPSENYSYRAKSMSHLENLSGNCMGVQSNDIKLTTSEAENPNNKNINVEQIKSIHSNSLSSGLGTVQSQPKTVSRNCIMKTLQNWRDNILNKQVNDVTVSTNYRNISSSDIGNNNGVEKSFQQVITVPNETTNALTASSLRRSIIKRREPRRHTVGANGIDIYAIKRFQQLEQEKDILKRGLNEIEKTKEWYIRQISNTQEKINLAGSSGSFPSDCNIDAYQERINFQATRIQNLNQHLTALRDAGHSFPMHMNLAIRPLNGIIRPDPNQPKQLVVNPNLVNKLKEQNRLLTEEVSRKSDRITQLEREKSSLIRELFQARTYSSYYNGDFDDTCM